LYIGFIDDQSSVVQEEAESALVEAINRFNGARKGECESIGRVALKGIGQSVEKD
jgi:hypothetical protein